MTATSAGRLRVALLARAVCALFALGPIAEPGWSQSLHLRSFGVGDGLPSAQVQAIGQAPDGHLWLATGAGLAWTDGRTIEAAGMAEGLDWANQRALVFDAAGRPWSIAASAPFPVYRQDDRGRWRRVAQPRNVSPEASLVDVVLLEPSTAGGVRLALATERHGLYVGTQDDTRSDRWTWERVGGPELRIADLERWGGGLVAATDEGVVALVDGAVLEPRPELVPSDAPSRRVLGLAAARGASPALWAVGEGWVGRAPSPGRPLALLLEDERVGATGPRAAAVVDGLGGVSFACGRRLCVFHPERGLERLGREHGIDVGERIEALHVDREGGLWLGGSSGVQQVIGRHFRSWTREDGLFDDEVTAAVERRDGTIVLGHRGGLSVLRDDRVVDTRALPLAGIEPRRLEPVRDLLETRDGALWAALGTQGVLRLGGEGGDRRVDAADDLEVPATALAQTADGRVWVGSERGLWRVDGGRLEGVDAPGEPLKIRTLRALGEDLWIASADGVHRLAADGSWRSWRCGRAECDSAFSLLPPDSGDAADEILVGTAAGLYRLDARSEDRSEVRSDAGLRPADEPAFDAPAFLLLRHLDPRQLWIGTTGGVAVWTRGRLGAAAGRRSNVERSNVQLYSVEEGLAGREVYRSAGLIDRRGRVWIGTDRGVTVYAPRLDLGPPSAPRVELLYVEVDGDRDERTRVPLDRPLRLRPDADDLTFGLRAISLLYPEQVQLEVRLEPFDDTWIRVDGPEVRYTNLPAGSYTFSARARVRQGAWSAEARSAPLVVARPVVRRPWFYLLLVVALLAAILAGYDLLMRLRRSQGLEDEVDRRLSELKASEDRYRKTFRSIDDGVLTTDADGRLELLNPRAQAITGWSADEAAGQLLDDVLQLSRRGSDSGRLSILHGEPGDSIGPTIHAMLTARDGQRKDVELTTSPIFGRGRMIGLVVVLRDVSRRRELEAELARAQKLEAVGLLAGGIAHDFNNLLTVLLGNVSLVRDAAGLTAEDRRSLDDAETALIRARDLTQQLLTFSRGGAPVREAASIADVIRDSTSFVLRGSNVRCDLDLADDLRVVEIDAGQISQVLNNLLINAVQAMPSGGVIRVLGRNVDRGDSLPQALAPGSYVAIDIVDQGVGIPSEVVGRIFDPYFSTKQEGRGLGLASAYSIVKRHDGLLTVRSRPGLGTTFRIYLPASARARLEEGAAAADRARDRSDARVLLMDDDPAVRHTAKAMLERLGCTVTEASDGREAIDLYAAALAEGRRFDLVLTDLTVPGGMGGQAAVQRLLELDPEVVAVVYSGYSTDPVLAEYADYGFKGRLSKPFSLRDLSAVVADALDPSRPAQPAK